MLSLIFRMAADSVWSCKEERVHCTVQTSWHLQNLALAPPSSSPLCKWKALSILIPERKFIGNNFKKFGSCNTPFRHHGIMWVWRADMLIMRRRQQGGASALTRGIMSIQINFNTFPNTLQDFLTTTFPKGAPRLAMVASSAPCPYAEIRTQPWRMDHTRVKHPPYSLLTQIL